MAKHVGAMYRTIFLHEDFRCSIVISTGRPVVSAWSGESFAEAASAPTKADALATKDGSFQAEQVRLVLPPLRCDFVLAWWGLFLLKNVDLLAFV